MKTFVFANAIGWAFAVSAAGAETVDFVRDVRPIFVAYCYECHGPDEQTSGLRLDVRSAALGGGEFYQPTIVPGDPANSRLLHFVRGDDPDLLMPPEGPPLSAAQVALLTKWVKQGAIWPEGIDAVELRDPAELWSFQPLTRPAPPKPQNSTWARGAIDRFILDRLEREGLSPADEVDRRTWLRRVTLDLTGLPPSPEDVAKFLADDSTEAYGTVVQRLLNSPRYGERYAQHWLDVVRYADTHGFEVNTERPHAWPYRDYVIRSFNEDVPWDQFIREQFAGDALGQPEATGFLVTAAALLPGQIGKDDESKRLARQDELGEILINAGEAFLGLSIGCARCHNHKFDPISARDYYAMQAFFSGTRYGDRPMPPSPAVVSQVADLRKQLASVERELLRDVVTAKSGHLRAPVSVRGNIDRFTPVAATAVRFTVLGTMVENRREPCIDELEIFDVAGKNVAVSEQVTVTASGSNESERHQLQFINDGRYGNSRSWMSNSLGTGWVQFEFNTPQHIDTVIWSRDREGKLVDRLAVDYRIEVRQEPDGWITVADATDRGAFDTDRMNRPLFQPEDLKASNRVSTDALIADRNRVSEELLKYPDGQQMVFAALSQSPEVMHVLLRGDPEQPGDEVAPSTPKFLAPVELSGDSGDVERRQALAAWIANPHNPLTARVIANRIWQWHFGIGLVATANDFGNSGVPPTHPELLDWLASELIASGWSVKHLHKLIVLSSTYRQSHLVNEQGSEIDAGVRLLWRYPSRRLEAEAIRDGILAVSGQLDTTMFGRGYDLFDSRGGTGGFRPIESHLRPNGRRRLIYAFKVRMEREAVFGAFDCPDAGQSAPRRRQSTTPIQALNLFNSQFTIDLAEDFAARIRNEVGDDVYDQIRRGWNLAYSRDPDADELADAATVVQEHGLAVICRVLLNSNEFLFLP